MNNPFEEKTSAYEEYEQKSFELEVNLGLMETVINKADFESKILEIETNLNNIVNNYFSNETYFLAPFAYIARISGLFEKKVINAFVDFVAKASVVLAHLASWGDRNVVDGGVKLTVYSIRSAGQGVRNLQNGKIQSYFLVTVAGLFLLILWLVIV